MDIKDMLKKLHAHSVFTSWKKDHAKSFLAHVFKMLDDANKDDWQVGFYNEDDTITSFLLSKESVQVMASENIFKKPDAKILPLDESLLKLDLIKALAKAEKIQATEYSKEVPFKIIVIVQNLEGHGQVFNITYLTNSFKTLNMKIDTSTGKVVTTSLSALADFAPQK